MGRFGSTYTILNAMDGTVIVNATNQLSDLYIQWNQTVHDLRKYCVIYVFICYTIFLCAFLLFIQRFYYLTCCLLCIFINLNIIIYF